MSKGYHDIFVQPNKLKSVISRFVHTNTVSQDIAIIIVTCVKTFF